jgi:hypothetical protein
MIEKAREIAMKHGHSVELENDIASTLLAQARDSFNEGFARGQVIEKARGQERERCAKIAEDYGKPQLEGEIRLNLAGTKATREGIAAAIRKEEGK